jgi:hypothetical protein
MSVALYVFCLVLLVAGTGAVLMLFRRGDDSGLWRIVLLLVLASVIHR